MKKEGEVGAAASRYASLVPSEDAPVSSQRSRNMRAVRRADTKPELIVRRALHHAGYRFRLHRADLPGRPDIVLPKHRLVIFVHGCFWHRHEGCRRATTPKTRAEFWMAKFASNVARDERSMRQLRELGWRVVVVWECELGRADIIVSKVRSEISRPDTAHRPLCSSS
ncbi:very short patch repair endonuclease [Methylorubrum aminovorans]